MVFAVCIIFQTSGFRLLKAWGLVWIFILRRCWWIIHINGIKKCKFLAWWGRKLTLKVHWRMGVVIISTPPYLTHNLLRRISAEASVSMLHCQRRNTCSPCPTTTWSPTGAIKHTEVIKRTTISWMLIFHSHMQPDYTGDERSNTSSLSLYVKTK